MAAGFEQQDYKGATNTVLGFSWLLSWLQGTRGFSWQTAEADNLRFHPHLRGVAILFPYHHSSYFSSVKSLFHFKRQVKQYQGRPLFSLLERDVPWCFC
jgi:cytochrome c peroxidase